MRQFLPAVLVILGILFVDVMVLGLAVLGFRKVEQ